MGWIESLTCEQQKNSQWCWASVTASVFGLLRSTPITQEQVVCQALFNNACADYPTPDECNIAFPLELALQQVCDSSPSLTGAMSFEDIQHQIDALRRPVPIGVVFQSDLGEILHYCIIKGADNINERTEIILLDPAQAFAGDMRIPYADLLSGIALGATWTSSLVIP